MSGKEQFIRRAQARVGQTLRGKWRLDQLLGVGGMASVFAATHRNGMRGAVKMLHLELLLDDESRSRFLREGYVANRVDHPGAVRVLDDDVAEDGTVFLVMELLEGESLDTRVQARPGSRFEIAEVLSAADQLLDVLATAHAAGVIHRDLKPENLFLTRRGQLKVLDFGIARLREMSGATHATRTGSLMGTPAYMPPEQALGNHDAVDARTDLWSVGATLFRLLTGRAVHVADNVNKLLLAAMTQKAPPIASVVPSVPPALAAIVDRALAFDAADRWPDARSMQTALRQLTGGAVGAVTPHGGLFPGASTPHAPAGAPSLDDARSAAPPLDLEATVVAPPPVARPVVQPPALQPRAGEPGTTTATALLPAPPRAEPSPREVAIGESATAAPIVAAPATTTLTSRSRGAALAVAASAAVLVALVATVLLLGRRSSPAEATTAAEPAPAERAAVATTAPESSTPDPVAAASAASAPAEPAESAAPVTTAAASAAAPPTSGPRPPAKAGAGRKPKKDILNEW